MISFFRSTFIVLSSTTCGVFIFLITLSSIVLIVGSFLITLLLSILVVRSFLITLLLIILIVKSFLITLLLIVLMIGIITLIIVVLVAIIIFFFILRYVLAFIMFLVILIIVIGWSLARLFAAKVISLFIFLVFSISSSLGFWYSPPELEITRLCPRRCIFFAFNFLPLMLFVIIHQVFDSVPTNCHTLEGV